MSMMKSHIYKLKMFGWRLYIANVRMKKMTPAAAARRQCFYTAAMKNKRKRMLANNGGMCEVCGRKMKQEEMQLHHVLPYSEFPQYGMNPSNLEMVCDDCHHAIHLNPYTNLHRMEQKAQEFGFDLAEYYQGKKNSARQN